MKAGKATAKQQRFAAEYLSNGRNAAAAYRTVYDTSASAQRVAEEAAKLLKNPKIAPIIAAAEQKAAQAVARVVDRYAVTKESVVGALARLGFSDIRQVVRWGSKVVATAEDGTEIRTGYVEPINSDELDDDAAFAVSEISQTKDGIKIKLHDKRAALVDLGRHAGIFKDDGTPPANLDALRSEVYQAILGGLADRARSMHPVIEDASYQEIPKANGKGNGGSRS